MLDVTHVPAFSPEERPTYQVQARSSGRATLGVPARATKVWTVSSLLGGDLTSRKLLSAVETALEVVGSEPKPDVRFHEDTGLLIARGNEPQIVAIADVIEQLGAALRQTQDRQIADLRNILEECRRHAENLKQQLEAGKARPAQEPKPGEERPGGN